MATISSVDARARFTKALIDVYQERIRPTDFLRSFFPVTQSGALNVGVEVERMGEKIAADVQRGTEGNRNTFSLSTEKIWTPPLYAERFEMTELDLYDRVLGSQGNANENQFAALLNSASDRMGTIQDKIERSLEKQCSQVFMTGQVVLSAAETINFKRSASSIVDLTSGSNGGYFSTNSACFDQFKAGCDFLRQYGHSIDSTFVAIMGETALKDLLANTTFTGRQNLFNMALDQVQGPRRNAKGAAFHGIITAGSYKVELWTYPQIYDAVDATTGTVTKTKYIDDRYFILIPQNPRFKMAHALVPQLITKPGQVPSQATYVYDENIDDWRTSHQMRVRTTALAIPVAVDQIYTAKACA